MNKRVRLIDVAAAAQTSIKTVSRVLNHDKRVSAETREHVQTKINELGYQVDLIARSLRTGVDSIIGVIIPKIGDPFFAELVEEIEKVANERGISVIVGSTYGKATRESELVQGFIHRRVMGMIIAPQDLDYSFLKKNHLPVVFIDRAPNKFKGDVIRVNDEFGAKIATQHLILQGHKRIAFFSDNQKIKPSQFRFQGYKAALEEAKIEVDDNLFLLDLDTNINLEKSVAKTLRLKNPPTAFFTAKAEISISLVSLMHKMRWTDIALVSFDDFTLAASIRPAITVLDHSARTIGGEAIKKLFEKVDGKEERPREHLIPLHVIPRGSGEIAPKASK